ncbi:protein PERCC1-like [Saccoglossus kowalevskii]
MADSRITDSRMLLAGLQEDSDEWVSDDESDLEDIEDISPGIVNAENGLNVPQQLLSFAEMVNADIQKYFGPKKDADDACNIYEDRFSSGKSGRELYYADLLKIAQNGDSLSDELPPTRKDKKRSVVINTNFHELKDKGSSGIGPLNELFEFAVGKHIREHRKFANSHHKKIKKIAKVEARKYEQVIPWQNRNLPKSFFKEPNSTQVRKNGLTTHPPNTPNFSELIANFSGSAFNGGSSELPPIEQRLTITSVESMTNVQVY